MIWWRVVARASCLVIVGVALCLFLSWSWQIILCVFEWNFADSSSQPWPFPSEVSHLFGKYGVQVSIFPLICYQCDSASWQLSIGMVPAHGVAMDEFNSSFKPLRESCNSHSVLMFWVLLETFNNLHFLHSFQCPGNAVVTKMWLVSQVAVRASIITCLWLAWPFLSCLWFRVVKVWQITLMMSRARHWAKEHPWGISLKISTFILTSFFLDMI